MSPIRVLLAALISLSVIGCQSGCRGLAPEATTMVGQAFRDCANQNIDAMWAVTSEGFRVTGRQQVEFYCQSLSETVGEFQRIDNVSGVNRQVNANGNVLSLALETSFAVGSVDASAIVIKQDGAWRLEGFQVMVDEAPQLERDDEGLPALATEHATRFARGDFAGFHGAFAAELRAARPLEELEPEFADLIAGHGSPSVLDEVTVQIDGEEHRVTIPLEYESGRAGTILTYQWRGAAWALLRYDVRAPPQTERRIPPASGKP
jgi:hypothetical protein